MVEMSLSGGLMFCQRFLPLGDLEQERFDAGQPLFELDGFTEVNLGVLVGDGAGNCRAAAVSSACQFEGDSRPNVTSMSLGA